MKFSIGSVDFGHNHTVVIAEAGVNHLGDLSKAERLILAAKRGGADIIKFQTYKAHKLTTKNAPRFWDWEGERNLSGSQFDSYSILDSFEESEHSELVQLCKQNNIEFLSTPFDEESADMLVRLGMGGFKIASCDITNIPFLQHIARYNLPILLSTGAASIEDIRIALECIESESNAPVGIMHCTLCYPTAPEDANLKAINNLAAKFPDHMIGFSDHTLGTTIASASILYGVKFIEKHFTYDKTLPDSADHWLSLDENELNKLTTELRILEKGIAGSGVKEKLLCEERTFKYARRSIVTLKEIKRGELFSNENLACKRPGTGMPPAKLSSVIGKRAKVSLNSDHILSESDIEQ